MASTTPNHVIERFVRFKLEQLFILREEASLRELRLLAQDHEFAEIDQLFHLKVEEMDLRHQQQAERVSIEERLRTTCGLRDLQTQVDETDQSLQRVYFLIKEMDRKSESVIREMGVTLKAEKARWAREHQWLQKQLSALSYMADQRSKGLHSLVYPEPGEDVRHLSTRVDGVVPVTVELETRCPPHNAQSTTSGTTEPEGTLVPVDFSPSALRARARAMLSASRAQGGFRAGNSPATADIATLTSETNATLLRARRVMAAYE